MKYNREEIGKNFKDLFENSLDLIYVNDLSGNILDANDIALKALGYEREELQNISFINLVDQEQMKKVIKFAKEIIETGRQSERSEYKIKRKDGKFLFVETYGFPLKKDGKIYAILSIAIDITERKKAEVKLKETKENLRESEKNFRTIIEQSVMGIVIYQRGQIQYVNKEITKILEYSEQEMMAWSPKDMFSIFLTPTAKEQAKKRLEKRESGVQKKTTRNIYELTTKSGNVRIVEVTIKSINYRRKPATLAWLVDITERKHAEQKLEQKIRETETFINNIPHMAWLKDIDSNFILANQTFGDVVGMDPEYLRNNTCAVCFGEEAAKKFKEDDRVVMEGKKQIILEETIVDKDGNEKHLETTKSPIFNDNGDVIGTVGIAIDITERKKAEQELKIYRDHLEELIDEKTKELKKSEEKYRIITETANDLIRVINDKFEIEYINELTHLRILGYSKDEMIGKFAGTFMHPDEYEKIGKYAFKFQKYGYSNREGRFKHKNGTWIWMDIKSKSFFDNDGNWKLLTISREITDRKKAEQKLRESKENYRNMINNLDVGFYKGEFKGKLLMHNPVLNKILGIDPSKSLIGSKASQFFTNPEDQEIYYERLINLGFIKNFIIQVKKVNGEKINIEINAHMIYNVEGKPKEIEGTFADITEKYRLEQKLKDSEIKYRHLFESSPYVIGLLDLNGKFIDCNTAVNSFLSLHTREDLIGKNFREIFSIPDKNKHLIPILEKIIKIIIKGDTTETFEFPVNRLIGDVIWISLHCSLIKIEKETLIQILIQDITERKSFEQTLKRSEQKFRFLFENTPSSILLINPDGIIVDCNPATEKITGYKKQELIGRSYRNLSAIAPKDVEITDSFFKQFFEGKEIHRLDLQIYHKDGNLIWVNLQSSLVKIGEKKYMQLLINDITERKNAEALVKEEIKKLKELDQIRKNLIIRVSHELKTPLIPVCGGAELLLDEYKDQLLEKGISEIIKMIDRGGRRLKSLINKLLDLSRLEYGVLSLEKQKSNLSEIIKESSADMNFLIKNRDITLNLEIPDNFYLDIDTMRINQVITNLLSNAIKNTPPQGKISITLQKDNNWAKITVADTGVGLTKEEMGIIFTRFCKIERNEEEGLEYIDITGSGLGLYISKEIIDLHGGKIWVESQGRGLGSNFIIKIPI